MNIRDLTYFVALADLKHFGKAADRCFVSQPALSMQIQKLERYFDVQLIERTNKSVLLTEVGLVLADYARHILNQIEDMRDVAELSKDLYSGELKIGVIPTVSPYLLSSIMPELIRHFPKLKLYLIEEKTATLLEKLKLGVLDAAILAFPIETTCCIASLLFEEEFVLAVPSDHALAKRKLIKQYELANQQLLLLEEGHCLREQALAVCHLAKASEIGNFRATSLETLRYMVASGVGMTLMPKLAAKLTDGIAYVPFSAPKPSRSIGMVSRVSSAKEKLLRELVDRIKKIMATQKSN